MSATDPSGFAESALEEMFVMAERIRHAAAGVFSFTAGSASAEAPETGLPIDDATGLEELLVHGARIRPGGAAAVPVTPQSGKCWDGEKGNFLDGVSGFLRQVGNDIMWLGGFLGSMGTLSPEQHTANATEFGSNNTAAGLLGSDLAPAAQLAIPVARLGYVTSAARIPGTAGSAVEAVAMRNKLKFEYRLGTFANSRMGNYVELAATRTDAQIIASAGRTNGGVNASEAAFAGTAASPGGCP
jgi:hypothetical protein